MPSLLETRSLRKSFGSFTALDGVSLAVEEGEIFGLLGPNGAGKTTLLSILTGVQTASAGEVVVDRETFHGQHRLKRLLGLAPQELALYGELTPIENLRFFGELYGLSGAALDGRISDILQAVGLADRAHHRVSTFSGGMQRRLNLAAALVHGPRILLLDEPTTGVDPQSRHHIFEEVRRLQRQGLTIIYTSHYMEEVEALCSRIGIIDQGRVVACDTLDNLLRRFPGSIRFRLREWNPVLQERLNRLDGVTFERHLDGDCELRGPDVKNSLLRLIEVLREAGQPMTSLDVDAPNLERVFLHLTGRALRD